MSDFWSTSDFVYMCLRDRRRTMAFRRALHQVVSEGDRVLDVGSGSGVLALMAAQAGAGEVLALERDPELAARLRHTTVLNGLDDRVRVLEGDVFDIDPGPCDVVVSELIETGLIDEAQVPVHNHLVASGVIAASTTVVPCRYDTSATLVASHDSFYGLAFDVVRHDWPFYDDDPANHWEPSTTRDLTEPVPVWSGGFGATPLDPRVDARAELTLDPAAGAADAVRLTGVVTLAEGLELAACPAMNGPKVIPLPEAVTGPRVDLSLTYTMGAGLGGLTLAASSPS